MPVNLSAIPDNAKRKRPPSLKRWLVVLLIFMIFGGFFTSWLWPVSTVRGALFWHCFISAPLVIWIFLAGSRWLVWLASEWPAGGWDDERERDIADEVQRGQRALILDSMCVHLPHLVTSGALTEQFLLPQGVVLPPVIDETAQTVSYIAQFSDVGQPAPVRIERQLCELLEDAMLRAALLKVKPTGMPTVIIQIDSEVTLSSDEIADIRKCITSLLSVPARIQFLPYFGLSEIDSWLDEPKVMSTLLLLSVSLRNTLSDGDGEAAVALLLHQECENYDDEHGGLARIHRPEHSLNSTALQISAMQSLLWGKTCTEEIASVWVAGMGTNNETQSLLASNNLKFQLAETHGQLTDIDMKSGRTGATSPWLAIALAAGNSRPYPFPQLIMSMPEDGLPWWMVVHPLIGK